MENIRVQRLAHFLSPYKIKKKLPLTREHKKRIKQFRKTIDDILAGKDSRMILIVGPCSIHDFKQAEVYGERLAKLSKQVEDKFVLVMRTFFEKPRTSEGWQGYINDPDLDGSFKIGRGFSLARKLLIKLTEKGVPCATEFLGAITPQYMDDLIAYAAIGARTVESPIHRQLASGLSMSVGFKNTLSGDVSAAVNAVKFSTFPQAFVGVDKNGRLCKVITKGNPNTNVILRGGGDPNYSERDILLTSSLLKEKKLPFRVIIDCSHGNSKKDCQAQPKVLKQVMQMVCDDKLDVAGLMLESNLVAGSQKIPSDLREFDKSKLEYGVSVTDSCLGWDETESLILELYEKF